jgi:hypothetical protein
MYSYFSLPRAGITQIRCVGRQWPLPSQPAVPASSPGLRTLTLSEVQGKGTLSEVQGKGTLSEVQGKGTLSEVQAKMWQRA